MSDLLDDGEGGFTERQPLCPFCSAPWTADMVRMLYDDESWGSDSMGSFTTISWVLDINCSSCKRLIYRKEGRKTF